MDKHFISQAITSWVAYTDSSTEPSCVHFLELRRLYTWELSCEMETSRASQYIFWPTNLSIKVIQSSAYVGYVPHNTMLCPLFDFDIFFFQGWRARNSSQFKIQQRLDTENKRFSHSTHHSSWENLGATIRPKNCSSHGFWAVYRDQLKGLYMVARNFFLLFLNFSAWLCPAVAYQNLHSF